MGRGLSAGRRRARWSHGADVARATGFREPHIVTEGLEIELDNGPGVPAEDKTSPGPTAPDPKSIHRLLKRFGIK